MTRCLDERKRGLVPWPIGRRRTLKSQAPLKDSPGIYQLVVNPGFLLDKRCQGLHFFLGKLEVTLFFLDLGQVPLKIQERFPETGQHVLKGV